MSDILKTADEWLKEPKYDGFAIIDPDGWRGEGRAWTDLISEGEFNRRLAICTIKLSPAWLQEKMEEFAQEQVDTPPDIAQAIDENLHKLL